MLTEVMQCFEKKQSPEQMVNEWKWGHIKYAFAFICLPFKEDRQTVGQIFAACPDTVKTNFFSFFGQFPNVYDLEGQDNPYFMFGLQRHRTDQKYSLVFMYCEKTSVMYPAFLSFFKLQEPSCNEVKEKAPNQYWETTVHDGEIFKETHIDDQFVRWGAFNSELDWVFRFNQAKCTGVVLMARDFVQSIDVAMSTAKAEKHLDLRNLTEKFQWISDYQVARFNKETQERLSMEGQDEKVGHNNIDWNRRRLTSFADAMEKYKDNRVYIQNLGFRSLGIVETPLCEHFDAPWPEFGYFVSSKYGVVLRSIAVTRGYFNRERVDSFVLDTDGMTGDVNVLLPHGRDIKPYLNEYPTTGILYEHVRADKRARIIVQPNIAYLYHDKKLMKILVCNDKNGPVDHGWSLQRGYYCYEGMPEYYWPVSRGYCPLEVK